MTAGGAPLLLFAALTLALAPHAERVPGAVSASTALLVAWRVALELRGWAPPRRWLVLGLTAAGLLGVGLTAPRPLGRDAALNLLVLLAGLKLLELRARRDRILVVYLSWFLVLANLLYDQSPAAAVHLGAVALLSAGALVGLADATGAVGLRERVALGGRLVLQALPLALALFVLFPRVSGRLWGLPADAHRGLSGLSETMSPGSVSSLALSDEVAFRVRVDGPLPAPAERYWRGVVLERTDGVRWMPGGAEGDPPETAAAAPAPEHGVVGQEVTLEAHGGRWLLALDRPVAAPGGARLTRGWALRTGAPVRERRRYAVASAVGWAQGAGPQEWEQEDAGALAEALSLPSASPRMSALARRWRDEAGGAAGVVERALGYFGREDFVYTLSPPLLGPDPVDAFLFEARAGFCEHFAAAFGVLMRAAGVPARVVTGYQGGEENPVGGYILVRQADAHAWNEVWIEGRGWVRVDPTAAVAPERIERSILAEPGPGGEPVRYLLAESGAIVTGLRFARAAWDALGHGWSRWVVGYDQARQRDLLFRLGYRGPTWRGMVLALAAVGGCVLAVLGVAVARRGAAPVGAPEVELYRRFRRRLARAGLAPRPHEGPEALARRVGEERPDLAQGARAVTAPYVRLRYAGAGRRPEDLALLRRAVRAFRPGRGPK